MNRSIQYLRGIAAASVVFKHAAHPGGSLETLLHSGVDLFFIISGFVMVASTDGRDVTAPEFIAKRCLRVLPMWWLTLTFIAVLGLGAQGLTGWLLSLWFIPLEVSEFGIGIVFWGVGWTLVFEAVFYAFFAAGLALKARNFIFLAIPAMVALGALLGWPGVPLITQAMHPLLLEFVMGALIGKAIMSGVKLPVALVPIGIALLLAGSMVPHNPMRNAITLGVPWALIVAGLAGLTLPELRPLRLLGDASYSIYLLHYVPIFLAWSFIPKDSYWPLTALAGIGVGILAYRYLEAPLLKACRARQPMALPSIA